MITMLFKSGDWQYDLCDESQCTVVKITGRGFGVLDHSIQTIIAVSDNQEDCECWIKGQV